MLFVVQLRVKLGRYVHTTVGCSEGHPAGNSRVNAYLLTIMKEIKRYIDKVYYALSGKLTVGGSVVVKLDSANR